MKNFHHVEFYCGDATAAASRFVWGLGMKLVAKSDQVRFGPRNLWGRLQGIAGITAILTRNLLGRLQGVAGIAAVFIRNLLGVVQRVAGITTVLTRNLLGR